VRMEGIWLEKHFNIPSEPQPDGPGHPCISDRRAIKEAQIHRNMLGLRSRVMHVVSVTHIQLRPPRGIDLGA